MPLMRPRLRFPWIQGGTALCATAILIAGVVAARPQRAQAQDQSPVPIRARHVELHYRLVNAESGAEVELWYTRDGGATWLRYGTDGDPDTPFTFVAPAEGLYGFILIPVYHGRPVRAAPAPHDTPQRWVFVDYTPPLVQWNRIEPADDFARRRVLRLNWTVHDDHLVSRPISLWYQSSVDQTWQPIEESLANTGRYDWKIPEEVSGQLTLKLVARDQGGHVVERVHGPFRLDRPSGGPPGTRPAGDRPSDATPVPRDSPPETDPASAQDRDRARDLHRQGSWHLARGQYALAAERFREALARHPDLVPAMVDLGGVYYLDGEYGRALELYAAALERDADHRSALRGAALAYVARKEYPRSRDMLRRLLSLDEHDAEAWLDLGDVLFMMGDQPRAGAYWERALSVDADANEVIRKATRRLQLYGATPSTAGAASKPQGGMGH